MQVLKRMHLKVILATCRIGATMEHAMQKVTRRRQLQRSDALRSVLLWGVVAAGMTNVTVAGADSPHPAVETCRTAVSDAERISCLEEALEKKVERDADASRRAAATGNVQERAAREPSRAAVNPAAEPAPVEGIGADQVRLRKQSAADIEASLESASGLRVARYREVPYRRLQIELENGQVWRQIAGDTQRLRVDLERNQTVDIDESRISGYKLRLNEIKRTIRVERIR